MGDSAQVAVIDGDTPIYLYTHWHGTEWPETLRSAMIEAKHRWDDPPYFTRILASQMFSDIHDSETGGGISVVSSGDRTIRVDLDSKTVYMHDGRSFTFDEFINQTKASWK